MKRKSFEHMNCPIAQSLEVVGEWWTPLILRDTVAFGTTRFDEIQKSLGIAPTVLTSRLNALVETGLLERRQYNERPPRFEYLPTEAARDFEPVLEALHTWGRKWTTLPSE
ncbi:MAG: helix-turn-helix transcriptional regulator [Actinomycetia bacterium]|nr:helix-turn-helix transcriptional regulator [Actinomycetes bacterium]MCP5033838.1 helix-turn-helix transcriptional regulator [Actinomycetes bacterium]